MHITPEGTHYIIVSDFMLDGVRTAMPPSDVIALQTTLRQYYPDVLVGIRSGGELELRFEEPFFNGLPSPTLEQELKSFMFDRNYKV